MIAKNHDMPQTGFEKKAFFRVHSSRYIIAPLTQISPRYNIEFGGSHTSDIFDKLLPIGLDTNRVILGGLFLLTNI